MKKILCVFAMIFIAIFSTGCATKEPHTTATSPSTTTENVELIISAAASLTDALNDLKVDYEAQHNNVTLTFNFNSSGKLVQQIEQGAPADIFLSASKKDMDTLQEANLLLEETRVNFASNELVLITNSDNNALQIQTFEDITPEAVEHFAVGDPESVPVGRYTKEVFEHLGLWEGLESKIVYSGNVRQVLTHVEMGNADAGVVYSSDAKISDKVKVLAAANAEWHEPIVYPAAVVSTTKHADEAKAFLTFLLGDEGKEVLRQYGFQSYK